MTVDLSLPIPPSAPSLVSDGQGKGEADRLWGSLWEKVLPGTEHCDFQVTVDPEIGNEDRGLELGTDFVLPQRQAVRLTVCIERASLVRDAPSPAPTSQGRWPASLMAVRGAAIVLRVPSSTTQPVSRSELRWPGVQGPVLPSVLLITLVDSVAGGQSDPSSRL